LKKENSFYKSFLIFRSHFCNSFFLLRRFHEFARKLFAALFHKYRNYMANADEQSAEKFLDLQKTSAASIFDDGNFQCDCSRFASKQRISQALDK